MKIFVKVKALAWEEEVRRVGDFNFVVSVKAVPVDGKANEAVINLLAKYFNIPKTSIYIASGFTSRYKVFKVSL